MADTGYIGNLIVNEMGKVSKIRNFLITDKSTISGLTWDNTNERLGVNVDAPICKLDVFGGLGNLVAHFVGEVRIGGTNLQSHFNLSTTEDTYIRGGKTASNVFIGDTNTGFVGIKTIAGNNSHALVVKGSSAYGLYVLDTTEAFENFSVSEAGNVYIRANCSFATFTDRTKYPESTKQALDALNSMTAKAGSIDHDKLDPFIKGKDDVDSEGKKTPTRDVGATISCLVEVVKDLVTRLEKLEKV